LRFFFARYKDQEISGVFTVVQGKTVYALAAGSLSEYWALRPNDLLHWKVMEWACERHFSRYYMGLIDDPIPREESKAWGIWRWKREWNGRMSPLSIFDKIMIPRYRYVLEAKRLAELSYGRLKKLIWRAS